ncbi:MAG: hypothetical protein HFF18_00045 [Oscillospiraceae bacterium]|nr:hypothetical protein [Oscillospiraceae bacterium]
MNPQDRTGLKDTVDTAQLGDQLEALTVHSQQVIDRAKSALLLADRAALFGAALANRINANALKDWNRASPDVGEGFASIEAARSLLDGIRAELASLRQSIDIWEEEA